MRAVDGSGVEAFHDTFKVREAKRGVLRAKKLWGRLMTGYESRISEVQAVWNTGTW